MNITQRSGKKTIYGQALPKEFQFESGEVYIKRVGKNIILTAKDDPWQSLLSSLDMFSDDFMTERKQPNLDVREEL